MRTVTIEAKELAKLQADAARLEFMQTATDKEVAAVREYMPERQSKEIDRRIRNRYPLWRGM